MDVERYVDELYSLLMKKVTLIFHKRPEFFFEGTFLLLQVRYQLLGLFCAALVCTR